MSQEIIWNLEYKKNNTKWNRETKLPQIFKGKKVLELGCGNGKTLLSIIKQKPLELKAIDFSQEALNSAKIKLKGKSVEFIKSDITKLPFEDKEFDIIVCYYVLNNLLAKERVKAVKEMKRVLGKNGIILFKDFSEKDLRKKGKEIEKNTYEKKNGLFCHFFNIEELKDLFKDFSFLSFQLIESNPFKGKDEKRSIIQGIIKN